MASKKKLDKELTDRELDKASGGTGSSKIETGSKEPSVKFTGPIARTCAACGFLFFVLSDDDPETRCVGCRREA